MMEAANFASTSEAPHPRRVVTAPPQRTDSISAASSHSDDLVETLYYHPSIKIIAFTSSQRTSLVPSPTSTHEERPGTLPASSRLERTIAIGPFRIYRAPGSVAFLSCGSALQPILPKSQCWCITEDNSRFVLQIRRPQYWRIELPVSEPDDAERALVLRGVFDKILLFEKTECPFQRSFTVELPEPPRTPTKKKAWTPVGKNLISSPFLSGHSSPKSSPSLSPSPRAIGKARRSTLSTDEIESFKISVESDERRGQIQRRAEWEGEQYSVDSTPPAVFREDDEAGYRQVSKSQTGLEPACSAREVVRNVKPAHHDKAPKDILSVEDPISVKQTARALDMEEARVTSTMARKEILRQKTEDKADRYAESKGTEAVGFQGHKDATGLSSGDAIQHGREIGNAGLRDREANLPIPTICDPAEKQELGDEAADDPSSFEGSGRIAPVNLTRKRMSRMLAGRTFTAPPQLTVVTSSPSKPRELSNAVKPPHLVPPVPPVPPQSDETSPVGSSDSFHSLQSWHSPITPLPPSPPTSRPITPSPPQFPHPHENIILPQHAPHTSDASDYTATPNTDRTLVPSSAGATDHTDETGSPMPCSPVNTNDHDVGPVPTDGTLNVSHSTALEERPQARQRLRSKTLSISRRVLSPLPPAANLFSPPARESPQSPIRTSPQSRLDIVRQLPGQIVHKTVEILLSPPNYLVNLMLKVAAKIVAGEWRGLVFGFGEGGEKIPVQWDYSDGEFSDWSDEEDYATVRNKQSSSSNDNTLQTTTTGLQSSPEIEENRSWDVD
ncbi:inheritance of peroxisomes protein 1-domain-containing protein [Xylariaceae sp. FL0662B]|nr:inheritance of peroxisomes protein 1-domain-containing protein [Xylariaceae sp. FL0662B]